MNSEGKQLKFKFEDLIIWQKSMDMAEELCVIAKSFPKNEDFNLTSQLCRAVGSIALNISEGAILQSKAEFSKFLGYAIRSLAEVVTCLHKASRRKYISESQFNKYYKDCFDLMNMTIAFRNKLK